MMCVYSVTWTNHSQTSTDYNTKVSKEAYPRGYPGNTLSYMYIVKNLILDKC